MLHVETINKVQKKCRMYWKYQAVGVLQTFSLHFLFSAVLQLFADMFSKMQSYILNDPLLFLKKINDIQ